MKKLILAVLVIALVAASVFAQGAAEAQAEKKTLVISTWGLSEDSLWATVYEPFEKKYNCTVVLDTGNGGERLTKLKNDPNSNVDIIELAQRDTANAAAEGLTQPVTKAELTVYSEVLKAAQDMVDAGLGLPYTLNSLGIIYNPAKIGFEIKNWKDLWNPRLEGKIAIPAITSTFGPAFVTMCAEAFGDDIASDGGAKAFEHLADLKKNVHTVYSKSSDVTSLMANGEVYVAIVGDFAVPVVSKADPDMIYYYPEEGTYVNFNAINITKNSKNKDLAVAYMNWRAGVDAQTGMNRDANENPVNTKVTKAETASTKMTKGDLNNAKMVDFAVVNPLMAEWVDKFNHLMNK